MSNKAPVWEIMRRRPTTLVSVTYGTDGQLHQNVISGPKLAFLCLFEEGLYILHGNRGLQIASTCDRRKCYITQVCHCAEQQQCIYANINTTIAETRKEHNHTQQLVRRYGQGCVLSRLHLYEAADEIRSLRLCFLAHPRTLSWGSVFDSFAFHFDSELEEHYASIRSYAFPAHTWQTPGKGVKECPQGFIELIKDTWKEFLDCGGHSFKPAIPLPEREDNKRHTNDKDVDDTSEWDDADVPLHGRNHTSMNRHKKLPVPEDNFDFDLIDDLIEEEFPRLKKTLQKPRQAKESKKKHRTLRRKFATKYKVKSDSNCTKVAKTLDEGPPVPVIIPPKNMLIGRGLEGCSFGTQRDFVKYEESWRPYRTTVDIRVALPC
ncbi:hypothetical protein E0Z10_g1382 [Xylaria hypoxylon]|uniref:Uncharacterized protein n=1 Tax=Xylaria hypoxylon TaxID=37992 RepID=A0A4Z0Z7C4_9PEZI|nr:hypothetical protein E0Z10_g1382 [Xylaria hypoxylon]